MASIANPYIPSYLKTAFSGSRPIKTTFADISNTNISSTASFMYDQLDAPLKSTQQLNVDWSRFEHHTFFMSAEAKVNLAFDRIINKYPFDGTRKEVEQFVENLGGFDKWTLDNFPVYKGELRLQSGSYIKIIDAAGVKYPELSKNASGISILNPGSDKSLSVEMQVLPISGSTATTQTIFQKLSDDGKYGYSFFLSPTLSVDDVVGTFVVVSGSTNLSVTGTLSKIAFNHVCATLNRESSDSHFLELYVDEKLINSSRTIVKIGNLPIDASSFYIGSGSAISTSVLSVTPDQTFDGTLDEFRVFHAIRTIDQQRAYAAKSIYANDDLKLYYKFNEPGFSVKADVDNSSNGIVIDSSGNSLHSNVTNYVDSLRIETKNDNLSKMTFERDSMSVVLFPAYQDIVDLNIELLTSASLYDQNNPNIITRLVPQHYLLEGALQDGFVEPECNGNNPYNGSGIPGQGKLGNVQLFLSLLYIWAQFFDEMKLYTDSFSTLRYVDYETNETVPDNFLLNFAKQFGFFIPPMFNDSTIDQYVNGENIQPDISNNEHTLKYIQTQMLRRILKNLPAIIRSKGTQHSIKTFLRAVGIDPENNIRIREYGGPTTKQMGYAREYKREQAAMVQFTTSSYAHTSISEAYSDRIEPGWPPFDSYVIHKDHYPLTSGSWAIELAVKFDPLQPLTSVTQSLSRLIHRKGANNKLAASLISLGSEVKLYVRQVADAGYPDIAPLCLPIEVPTGNLYDGTRWNICFGCQRNDEINSIVSSSYFLRIANCENGDIASFNQTSSFYDEWGSYGQSDFDLVLRKFSMAGGYDAYIEIGNNATILYTAGAWALNNADVVPTEAVATAFDGRLSDLRFWSKSLTEIEWKEHVRNYKSTGVEDPKVNWNFQHTDSGSFGRLRLNAFCKQETISSDTGDIIFLDFSQNNHHFTGSGFSSTDPIIVGESIGYSYLSPYFDEASTTNKIRARSYFNKELVDATPWASTAPLYEIVKSEEPTDDVRLAIEFSLIDALNRDIITMFATLDEMESAIGRPELMFSADYPDLEALQYIYFNRLQDKLNFKAFFEFFRWFDTSIGTFIEQLIPRKTNFKGINYVIESHMLERHKLEYYFNEMYLNERLRPNIRNVLLLQQIAGTIRKF